MSEFAGIARGVVLGALLWLLLASAFFAGKHFAGGWHESSVTRAALGGSP